MAYSKHNFKTGDTLYAAQLNEMDTQIAANEQAASGALPKSGGTMTGMITLLTDPTEPMQAATKQYVDEARQGIIDDVLAALPAAEGVSY